jgi:hypothetical protein
MRTALPILFVALLSALGGCEKPSLLVGDLREQGATYPATSKIVFVDMRDRATPPELRGRTVVTQPDVIKYVWTIVEAGVATSELTDSFSPSYLVEFYTGINHTIPTSVLAVNDAGVCFVSGGNRDEFGHIPMFFNCYRLHNVAEMYIENQKFRDRLKATATE